MRTSILLLVALSACVDPSIGRDRDGDGFFTSELDGDDCDDANANVNPDASEACANGIDDDCDGIIDDSGVGERTWFMDNDQDGFAGPVQFTGCAAPVGAFSDTSRGIDCDDTRSDINPGADEIWYDGVDQDCAEDDDNDADGDGFVAVSQGGDDCADDHALVNPNAVEVCNNGVDDDCDGGPNQCEYAGEVDLEAAASTVFASRSDEQWLDDFNGDGVLDVLLAVGRSSTVTRNHFRLFFGPLDALELQADAIIWGPITFGWDRYDRLVEGDFNGDGLTDIAVHGRYPDEQGSSVRIFFSPFGTGTLNAEDSVASVELIDELNGRQHIGTTVIAAIRIPGDTADSLFWNGQPISETTGGRLFSPEELQSGAGLLDAPEIAMPLLDWVSQRVDIQTVAYSVQAQTFGDDAQSALIAGFTVSSNGAVASSISTDTSLTGQGLFFPQLMKESRFDLDHDGISELVIGGISVVSRTGETDEDSQVPQRATVNHGLVTLLQTIPTMAIAQPADTLAWIETLAICDITSDQPFEYIEGAAFYNGSSTPETQTIQWSTFPTTNVTIGQTPLIGPNGYARNANCAGDGEHLFIGMSNESTLLIPPLRW